MNGRPMLLFAAIALGALLLQTTVLPLAAIGRATPDLLLIMCVYLGLHQHTVGGAIGAFSLGYLQDAFSGSVAGLNAFGMCLVFTMVYLTSRRLWVDNTVSKVAVVFLASVIKTMAILVLVAVFMSAEGLWRTMLSYLPIEAALAALLSPPVFAVLARTQQLQETEEE
ncbi:MAG TPA: rod shape-determining protein MreD [Caldimonas sp.]|nr:rod shape-determining protein MreD [Caldimonas sp.]